MKPLCAGAMLVWAMVAGCSPQELQKPWFGPTEPLESVVARVNANSEAVPTLWARHETEATLVDPSGRKFFLNADGVLMFRKPRQMLLRGNKDVAGLVFELGSDEQRFWMRVIPEVDTLWWGRHDEGGDTASSDIPIRADAVLEVLGIGDIPTQLDRLPAPVMRFNNDARVYMVVWVDQVPRRFVAVREVWYDMTTFLPVKVLLFDANGRVVLRANLSDHAAVAGAKDGKIATQYHLFFPDSQSRMTVKLSDIHVQKDGRPNERSFPFPRESDSGRVIRVGGRP